MQPDYLGRLEVNCAEKQGRFLKRCKGKEAILLLFHYFNVPSGGSQTPRYIPIKVSLYLSIRHLYPAAADVGGLAFSLHVDFLAYRC